MRFKGIAGIAVVPFFLFDYRRWEMERSLSTTPVYIRLKLQCLLQSRDVMRCPRLKVSANTGCNLKNNTLQPGLIRQGIMVIH